jgi:hypothetical protein
VSDALRFYCYAHIRQDTGAVFYNADPAFQANRLSKRRAFDDK